MSGKKKKEKHTICKLYYSGIDLFSYGYQCSVQKNKVSFRIQSQDKDLNPSLIASKAGKIQHICFIASRRFGSLFLFCYRMDSDDLQRIPDNGTQILKINKCDIFLDNINAMTLDL